MAARKTAHVTEVTAPRSTRIITCANHKPTVSPLMIPLLYCHINSFQRASSMEKSFPGGENKIDGQASHHEEL